MILVRLFVSAPHQGGAATHLFAILQRLVKGSLWRCVLLSNWSSVRVSMVDWRYVRPLHDVISI